MFFIPTQAVHADEGSTTVLVLDSLDSTTAWNTNTPSFISFFTDSIQKVQGLGSLKASVTNGDRVGTLYFGFDVPHDWSNYTGISLWIRSSRLVDLGEIHFDLFSDIQSLGSSTNSYPLPSVPANEWTQVTINLEQTATSTHSTVMRYGFELPLLALSNFNFDNIVLVSSSSTSVEATNTPVAPVDTQSESSTSIVSIAPSIPGIPFSGSGGAGSSFSNSSGNAFMSKNSPVNTQTMFSVGSTTQKINADQPTITYPPLCPYFSRTFVRGSRSTQIKVIQAFLMSAGFMKQDRTTTYFGKMTETAVRSFQADYLTSLMRNGIIKSRIITNGHWTMATYCIANQRLGCK
ncbi:peptidoglycan-binding protein [Patescibacteria group bacterium]|nr:peptidoglycan-binding protein [Patescibacteria group bacterium]